MGTWAEDEAAGCDLGDVRLNRRLGAMRAALGGRPGKSLPTAFQDWAKMKAACRFFANENVSEDKILAGHFAALGLRVQATDGPILMLQHTTQFAFKRAAPEKIGFTKTSCGRKGKEGRHGQHMIFACVSIVRGILVVRSLHLVLKYERSKTLAGQPPGGHLCLQIARALKQIFGSEKLCDLVGIAGLNIPIAS